MKNLICLLLVAFLATTTFAQRKGMTVKVDAAVERMTNELDLTPEQQVKIKAIYENKVAAKKSRNAQTKEEYATARADFDQQIKAVLTPEQSEKRNALKAEHKTEMKEARQARKGVKGNNPKGKGHAHRGKKRGQKLASMSPEMLENRAVKSTEKLNKQVNLTEDQQVSIKASYLAFYQRNQAIASDTSLDAAAKKESLTQLKADHRASIKTLLTEEQLAARKANKKVKKGKKGKKAKKENVQH